MKPATELFSSPWVTATLEENGRLVRVRRTSERLTPEALAALVPLATRNLPPLQRRRLRLLLDTREAPLLADSESERLVGESVPKLFEGFERLAVLVSTAVGRLQATRVSRQRGHGSPVFDDEAAALTFLLS